jgi:hypothetical protein
MYDRIRRRYTSKVVSNHEQQLNREHAMTDKPTPRPSTPKPKPIVNLAVERARRRPQIWRDRVRGG